MSLSGMQGCIDSEIQGKNGMGDERPRGGGISYQDFQDSGLGSLGSMA